VLKFDRERERLQDYVDQGWHNVSHEDLTLKIKDIPAILKDLPKRGLYSEWDFVKELFTDGFVTQYIISVINRNLAIKKVEVSQSNQKYYNAITLPVFWKFFGKYMARSLLKTGNVGQKLGEFETMMSELMGQNRYDAIIGACFPSEDDLEDLSFALSQQV
jgi:hypothetical protein